MPQDGRRFEVDPTVAEGGTIQFRCRGTLNELRVVVPGRGTIRVRVHNGRAEYQVPPDVPGGTRILVTDGVLPNPSGTSILVVGGSSR